MVLSSLFLWNSVSSIFRRSSPSLFRMYALYYSSFVFHASYMLDYVHLTILTISSPLLLFLFGLLSDMYVLIWLILTSVQFILLMMYLRTLLNSCSSIYLRTSLSTKFLRELWVYTLKLLFGFCLCVLFRCCFWWYYYSFKFRIILVLFPWQFGYFLELLFKQQIFRP